MPTSRATQAHTQTAARFHQCQTVRCLFTMAALQGADPKKIAKISARLVRKRQQRRSTHLVRSADGGALLEVLARMLQQLDPPLVPAPMAVTVVEAPALTDMLAVLPPHHAALLLKLVQTVLALLRGAVLSAPAGLPGAVVLDQLVGRLGPVCFGHALPTATRHGRTDPLKQNSLCVSAADGTCC